MTHRPPSPMGQGCDITSLLSSRSHAVLSINEQKAPPSSPQGLSAPGAGGGSVPGGGDLANPRVAEPKPGRRVHEGVPTPGGEEETGKRRSARVPDPAPGSRSPHHLPQAGAAPPPPGRPWPWPSPPGLDPSAPRPGPHPKPAAPAPASPPPDRVPHASRPLTLQARICTPASH